MAPESNAQPGIEIGNVAALKGQVFADFGSGVRPLSPGSPVHQGETIVTRGASHVEIRFKDDTILSEGEHSSIRLDSYVYDPGRGANDLLFKMAEGTFKVVTGKIADTNPEHFKIKSPLSTIGIRGTTTVHEIRGGVEKHGAEEIHPGKALTIQNPFGEIRMITQSGSLVDFRPDGSMGQARPFTPTEMRTFQTITPITILPSQPAPPPPSGGQGPTQQGGQDASPQGGQDPGAGGQGGGQGQEGQPQGEGGPKAGPLGPGEGGQPPKGAGEQAELEAQGRGDLGPGGQGGPGAPGGPGGPAGPNPAGSGLQGGAFGGGAQGSAFTGGGMGSMGPLGGGGGGLGGLGVSGPNAGLGNLDAGGGGTTGPLGGAGGPGLTGGQGLGLGLGQGFNPGMLSGLGTDFLGLLPLNPTQNTPPTTTTPWDLLNRFTPGTGPTGTGSTDQSIIDLIASRPTVNHYPQAPSATVALTTGTNDVIHGPGNAVIYLTGQADIGDVYTKPVTGTYDVVHLPATGGNTLGMDGYGESVVIEAGGTQDLKYSSAAVGGHILNVAATGKAASLQASFTSAPGVSLGITGTSNDPDNGGAAFSLMFASTGAADTLTLANVTGIYGGAVGVYDVDTLLGSGGDDQITYAKTPGAQNPTIFDLAGGNDQLFMTPGVRVDGLTVFGEAGNDTIMPSVGDLHLYGGNATAAGTDLLSYMSHSSFVTVDSGADTVTGTLGTSWTQDVHDFTTIMGTPYADTFLAGDNTSLSGSTGDDVFQVRTAVSITSTLNGGLGTDTLDFSQHPTITTTTTTGLDLNAGTGVATVGGTQTVAFTNMETFIYSGTGLATLTGGTSAETLAGGTGTNSLTGGQGHDVIKCGTGSDYVFFTGTTDVGAAGSDTIRGFTTGTDLLKFSIGNFSANTVGGGQLASADFIETMSLSGSTGKHFVFVSNGSTQELYYDSDPLTASSGECLVAVFTDASGTAQDPNLAATDIFLY